MKKKHQKELKKIKDLMINALEIPTVMTVSGSKKKTAYFAGEFVCHQDNCSNFDADFTVCGEDTDVAYLVMIQQIDL